ncbi:MAG: hypothetical protein KAU31_04205, partial [Spirochaetaceae bacterium]|nr:hypothetical protein [Spirochaetaceae bacterium]
GLKYAFLLWVVIALWGFSHPLMYETLDVRNQVFWHIYTLGGFVGYGLAFGHAYKRHSRAEGRRAAPSDTHTAQPE